MTALNDLNTIQRDIDALLRKAASFDQGQDALRMKRQSGSTMMEVLKQMTKGHPFYFENENAITALHGAIDELKHDIIRVAELRLAAASRALKVQAEQKKRVLDAAILPLPLEKES